MPIVIKDYSNIQDGVVLHALETHVGERKIDGRVFSIEGKKLMQMIRSLIKDIRSMLATG